VAPRWPSAPGLPTRSRGHDVKEVMAMFDLWTTAEVLTEFLAICSPLGPRSRQRAVNLARRILADPGITVLPQIHESCLEGLTRSEQRPDKHSSLTDCIAMHVMRRRGLTEVLSYDHHFEQEGFQRLFRSRVRGMNSPTGRSSPFRARLQSCSETLSVFIIRPTAQRYGVLVNISVTSMAGSTALMPWVSTQRVLRGHSHVRA
jgi:uncharacterized protein